MKTPWTAESVHFMREGKYGDTYREEINPAFPCFAFRPFTSEQPKTTEYCDGFSILHRYPRVLALGVLLVEICLRKEQSRTAKVMSTEERINSDFTRCSDIIGRKDWPNLDLRNQDAIRVYKDVVRKCLDPKLFHIPPSTTGHDQTAINKRRNALYTYVVLPLATLCAEFGIIDEADGIGRLTYSEPNAESLSPSAPGLPSVPRKAPDDTYTNFGSGGMLNAPGGRATRNDFNGATFSGPVHFGHCGKDGDNN